MHCTFEEEFGLVHCGVQVTMESGGTSQPLFMVTGCCLGHEFQLDMDHIPFGAVWQNSKSSRRILIINSGDIGARYCTTCALLPLS